MPVNDVLASRIRAVLSEDGVDAREQRMFGGVAFMVDDRFACGTMKDDIVLRIGVEAAQAALSRPGVRPMDFTRRPMAGWVYVSASALAEDAVLAEWVRMGVAYSATRQPSKQRSRKASQAAAVNPRQPPGARRI
jgi:TfoX/Sxy family transcriptional regulator of competence genes